MIFMSLLLMTVALPLVAVTAETWEAETIATGLDNPRGIAVAPDGTVYVAESGSGGSTENYDVVSGGGSPSLFCSGASGMITMIEFIDGAKVEFINASRSSAATSRLSVAFPSVANAQDGSCEPPPLGFGATGPSSLAVDEDGSLIVAMGMGGPPENQDILGDMFGSVYRVIEEDIEEQIANIPAFVATQSALMESNPYGVALVPEGVLVVDAGADSLFLIRNDTIGAVETVITFTGFGEAPVPELSCGNNSTPPVGSMVNISSVPTAVAVGPDGNYYVGFLTGEPYAPGYSKVLKLTLTEERSEPSVYVDNLTQVTGLDFDADGALYISQLSDASILEFEVCQSNPPVNGSVIKVDKNGEREIIGEFPYVNDVAVDKETGAVYVAINSILSAAVGGGSIVKLTKPEDPAPTDAGGEPPTEAPPVAATSAASRTCPWLFC